MIRKMSRISRILSSEGLSLHKSKGQNFLVNQGALEKIARSAEADENSLVIEIGCGVGNLTELLAREAGRVVAIELDERFQGIHSRELGDLDNLEFRYGDFMEFNLPEAFSAEETKGLDLRVVGNIPYHLTSPILFKLMASRVEFASICLLMQREVAHRLASRPGSRQYGILAVKASVRFVPEVVFTVSPGSFLPAPKVHSALIRLKPLPEGPLIEDPAVRRAFFNFVDAAFAQRRKFLKSTLAANSGGKVSREKVADALATVGQDEKIRAEALSVKQLISVFDALGQPVFPSKRKAYED